MKKSSNKLPVVLIVDDDADIRDSLHQYFEQHGMNTCLAATAIDARKRLQKPGIDIAILDIMMPGEDGLSLCRWMAENTKTPTILLTAMATDIDRIVGLEIGADDYVVKPFNPRVLLARIRAVLRRHNAQAPEAEAEARIRKFDKWTHDPKLSQLTHECGRVIKLTSTESRLLCLFLDKPNVVLERGYLIDQAFGREEKAYDRAIDNRIVQLRKKIEQDPSKPHILVTEWGTGYKLVVDVKELPVT